MDVAVSTDPSKELLQSAVRMVGEMDKTGIKFVLIAGSVAAGTAGRYSDIDLVIFGDDTLTGNAMCSSHRGLALTQRGAIAESCSVGPLPDQAGDYFAILEKSLLRIISKDEIETSSEFFCCQLLATGTLLWEEPRYLGSYAGFQASALRLLERGPSFYSVDEYEQEKRKLTERIGDLSASLGREEILQMRAFLFKAIGVWPRSIGRESLPPKHVTNYLSDDLIGIIRATEELELRAIKGETIQSSCCINLYQRIENTAELCRKRGKS